MSQADHAELLEVVRRAKGKVMISGYPCALYDEALGGWTRHAKDVAKHSAKARTKRRAEQVVWCNW